MVSLTSSSPRNHEAANALNTDLRWSAAQSLQLLRLVRIRTLLLVRLIAPMTQRLGAPYLMVRMSALTFGTLTYAWLTGCGGAAVAVFRFKTVIFTRVEL